MNDKPLTVILYARMVTDGVSGGIEQFMVGLVRALGELADGPERYILVTHHRNPDWLRPYMGPNQSVAFAPKPPLTPDTSYKKFLGPLRRPVGSVWRGMKRVISEPPEPEPPVVNRADAFLESLGGDVVHFPFQMYLHCSVPTIFNPHDLQHRHFPQFWPEETIAWREVTYGTACRESAAVAAESRWVKDDIAKQYGIDPKKIYAITRGAPTDAYAPVTKERMAEVKQKYALPDGFALFPGQTWAHKNHIRLLEAIRMIRDRDGITLPLVCTGRQNEFFPTIEKRLRELQLENQVRFLGFTPPSEFRAFYHLAQFVVFPTLFEGGGFPVTESFREGVPVTCSEITCLPEYGSDAVLLFDPTSVESIANALRRMATDAALRETLRQRGFERIRLYNWETTARTYRALYRKVAGRQLTEEDSRLLDAAG